MNNEMIVGFVDQLDGLPIAPLWVAKDTANMINDIIENRMAATREPFDSYLLIQYPRKAWTINVHADHDGAYYHHSQGVHHRSWQNGQW